MIFAETMTDVDYTNDLVLLADSPAQAGSLLHSLKQALYYHVANGFMLLLLYFKWWLNPVVTLPWKKVDKHTKTPHWFTNIKVYSLLYFLRSCQEKRNNMKN